MGWSKRYFFIIFAGMILGLVASQTDSAGAEVPENFLAEAKKLAELEKKFFDDRLNNRWEALYALQHPAYRKSISIEEFRYYEGKVDHNYREKTKNHMSGLMTPTLAHIKSNPPKTDALGFPIPRHYKWYVNPFVVVKDYIQGKISISKDGKYAIVEMTLTGRERLNTALVRDIFEFDFKRSYKEFWEKADGEWFITVLIDPSSISGAKGIYFIPNNNDAWGKMEFVEIEPESIVGPSGEK